MHRHQHDVHDVNVAVVVQVVVWIEVRVAHSGVPDLIEEIERQVLRQ